MVGLILFATFVVVRLHVIIGSSSELYQSYLAPVGNSNIFKGGIEVIRVHELWLLVLTGSFLMNDHHTFLVTPHHEGLPEVSLCLHRPLKQVQWVYLELLVIALPSSLDAYADAHVGLEGNRLVHENFHGLLHVHLGHFHPNRCDWCLVNRLIHLLALFQQDNVRFFVKVNFLKDHFFQAFYFRANFYLDFHDIVRIIWFKVMAALLLTLLVWRNVLLMLFRLPLLNLLISVAVLVWLLWLFLSLFGLLLLFISLFAFIIVLLWIINSDRLWVLQRIQQIARSEILLYKV